MIDGKEYAKRQENIDCIRNSNWHNDVNTQKSRPHNIKDNQGYNITDMQAQLTSHHKISAVWKSTCFSINREDQAWMNEGRSKSYKPD